MSPEPLPVTGGMLTFALHGDLATPGAERSTPAQVSTLVETSPGLPFPVQLTLHVSGLDGRRFQLAIPLSSSEARELGSAISTWGAR